MSREDWEGLVKCWLKVLSFGPIKKALLYVILGLILFLKPHRLWLSILAGKALLYFFTPLQIQPLWKKKYKPKQEDKFNL
jgi:hypothetical protein